MVVRKSLIFIHIFHHTSIISDIVTLQYLSLRTLSLGGLVLRDEKYKRFQTKRRDFLLRLWIMD